MRIVNISIFVIIFTIPVFLTLFTSYDYLTAPITYALWLTMEIGLITFFLFVDNYRRAKNISENLISEFNKYKVAGLVVSYNEDPDTVKTTLLHVKTAVGELGETFLLDDSTDQDIKVRNEQNCKELRVNYVHRDSRRGYKAGAINDFLLKYGNRFDIIAIFDSDQRPVRSFFHDLLPFFSDPEVAFVQVPQAYTELVSPVSLGAYYQQIPFMSVVMEGRNAKGSAFILGTGVLIRREAIEKVGLFQEDIVTEDLATSINFHDRGYRSIYVDYPEIWYGEAPLNTMAYMIQQGRWALGTFQSTRKILKSDIEPMKFIDYLAGFLYWLKEGPLTAFEIAAPILFLLIHIYILKVNPVVFGIIYYPFLLTSIGIFIYTMKEMQYKLKGFFYHQFLELIMMVPVTLSFFAWITGRKRPFKVTPKGKNNKFNPYLLVYAFLLIILIISIYRAFEWLLTVNNSYLEFSILINISWAVYFLFLDIGTFIMFFGNIKEDHELINKINNKSNIS